MDAMLSSIADWFTGLGVHPVLGGVGVGLVVGLLLRRSNATVAAGTGPLSPGMVQRAEVRLSQPSSSISINGRTLDLAPGVLDQVLAHVRNGQPIDAIKLLREHAGLGLAEAKQLVDTIGAGVAR